ncbi:MAG: membrane integrity-associated transporter subunit PqiC [Puniceicoccaceae bacterium]|nr:MAG: membrane integrity-associated transporter subunit PqiC [Puniceicoccaceae bacterium]
MTMGSGVGDILVWRKVAAVLAGGVMLLAAGCLGGLQPREDRTRHYLLEAPAAVEARSLVAEEAIRVGVLPVQVAPYLRNNYMVIREGERGVRFAEFHRWGEPPEQGIGRVLAASLNARPELRAVNYPVSGAFRAEFEVAVRVAAFEGRRGGSGGTTAEVRLEWEIYRLPGREAIAAGTAEESEPWRDEDFDGLVEALSQALQRAAEAVAAAIKETPRDDAGQRSSR